MVLAKLTKIFDKKKKKSKKKKKKKKLKKQKKKVDLELDLESLLPMIIRSNTTVGIAETRKCKVVGETVVKRRDVGSLRRNRRRIPTKESLLSDRYLISPGRD